ncbi:MAG: DNA-binding response regulator [Bacteroidetes bacterium RIFOXYA12_FULL_35_11]|nr:MAG: DNA-binding response regulator [Bacteroidetes bacterium GWF2_35_48]OFY78098.1 MAG: DNA-binding response regulator [Bacteroidetes bacterium RIFOXYA12_FULL_35_11]OFY98081.1 MAG: DNA-binding response regulator [Bacteroidetes bacterium RIFOXYC12_FULL_35_7]HBX53722.1 DNA-binding response regulator [Bacteroidales bacterium]
MAYKIMIIEDEEPARILLKNYLQDISELDLIAECSDGFTAVKTINELKPDLVFLDVQMPKLTGFEVLDLLDHKPLVVFSTAYDQYAIKAFEANAVDYLLKPYSRDRFTAAVSKALEKLNSGFSSGVFAKNIINTIDEKEEYIYRIAVKTKSKIHVIPVEDIFYFEAEGDYVMIHTKDGKFLKEKTMKYLESHLDPKKFIRVHRSFIANISEIARLEHYDKDSYVVIMKNNQSLRASNSGYKLLKAALNL